MTPFAVITDKKNNIKYPLADYELTPDVAIVDAQFVMTVPPHVTADTGMDVLTHAIEAYVSVMANDYTDGLALKLLISYSNIYREHIKMEMMKKQEKKCITLLQLQGWHLQMLSSVLITA